MPERTPDGSGDTALLSESVVIKAPPEDAFNFLADPATATIVDPAVISYEPDSLPMREGTRNRVRFRMFGVPVTITTRVVEWQVGRRMVIDTLRPERPIRARATHLFEPHPEGTTYTWSMEITPNGFGGRALTWLSSRFMKRAICAQQARFKELMESGRRSQPG